MFGVCWSTLSANCIKIQFYVGVTSSFVAMAGRGRAKSRDDITSLMHVIYFGEDAVPLRKDTELCVKELQDMPMQLKIIHSW